MKKAIGLIAVLVMCLSLFVGCGGSQPTTAGAEPANAGASEPASAGADEPADAAVDTSEEVNLSIYLYSYARDYEDSGLVFDEINKLLKEKINTTIEYTLDMVDDARRKIPLMMASGEYYDAIALPGDVYSQEIQKGGIMEIGDLLNEYLPTQMASMTEYDYANLQYEGGIYSVPGGFQPLTPQGYMIRGDLRKKHNIPEVTDLASLQVYMDTLAANEPGTIPFNTSAADNLNLMNNFLGAAGWVTIGNDLGYYMDDPELKLSFAYETPEYKAFLEKAKEFTDKGYWSKNAYAGTTISRDAFTSGTSFVATCHVVNANDTAIALRSTQPDWEIEFFMIPDKTIKRPTRSRMLTIPKISENPERLLMAIDQLMTDPELNSLLLNGIDGVHYTTESDGTIVSTPEGATKYPIDQFPLGWISRDLNLMKYVSGGIDELMDIQNRTDELSVIYPHTGFIMNNDSVTTEIAAVSNVLATMKGLTQMGAFETVDGVISDFGAEMSVAGADKVKAEAQRQLDEFMASL